MPVPFARKIGYGLTVGSLATVILLWQQYAKTMWIGPALYGAFGIALALYVVCALVLAADGIRLLLLFRVHRQSVCKIILDFLPLVLLTVFWMI